MGLILFALVGAFIGWLAAAIEEVDEGVLARIGVGAVGAIIGICAISILSDTQSVTKISWLGIVISIIGAVILLGIINRSNGYKPRGTHSM
jgi:uncharacterized membrane protein YeaQ/YmgE (transglycosylase-associated protein family)